MSQEVIDTLKDGEPQPGDDIRHLVNFWAVRIRATLNRELISDEQAKKVSDEFLAALDEMDNDTRQRFTSSVIDESKRVDQIRHTGEKTFWTEPADTAIKLMGNSLAKSIGV